MQFDMLVNSGFRLSEHDTSKWTLCVKTVPSFKKMTNAHIVFGLKLCVVCGLTLPKPTALSHRISALEIGYLHPKLFIESQGMLVQLVVAAQRNVQHV